MNTQYTITGKDKAGKRFRINTDTPQHYNIWRGTLWQNLDNGKRKLILTYFNF
jgi:hypothetical protein